jgi:hypothetical protein
MTRWRIDQIRRYRPAEADAVLARFFVRSKDATTRRTR